MINHIATYGNTLSLHFDSVEGKILFKSRVEGLNGIKIEKEGYKTLKLKVEDQALLESLRENLERRESLTIEDCIFIFLFSSSTLPSSLPFLFLPLVLL